MIILNLKCQKLLRGKIEEKCFPFVKKNILLPPKYQDTGKYTRRNLLEIVNAP